MDNNWPWHDNKEKKRERKLNNYIATLEWAWRIYIYIYTTNKENKAKRFTMVSKKDGNVFEWETDNIII